MVFILIASILIVFTTLLRLFFFTLNFSIFSGMNYDLVFWSFLYGIRYDIATLSITLLPLIIYLIINFNIKRSFTLINKTLTLTLITISNFIIFFITIFDTLYYPFSRKRITLSLFKLNNDFQRLTILYFIDYWYYIIFFIVSMVILSYIIYYILYNNNNNNNNKIESKLWQRKWVSLFSVVIILFWFIALRGGFQIKPLSPTHAYILKDSRAGDLAQNTLFNLIKTRNIESIKPKYYFSKNGEKKNIWDELIQKLNLPKNNESLQTLNIPKSKKLNIMIIILESFSREYMGENLDENKDKSNSKLSNMSYTPFLKSLTKKGIFFNHAFANGSRTLDALASVVGQIPSMMPETFNTSQYKTNEASFLPKIFKEHNYNSYFFHGAQNGSMYFDAFSQICGFDKYFMKNEYPDQNEYDGYWGIYDDKFFDFTCAKMDDLPHPFFVTFFSLSSHNPYTIPKKFQNKFSKGTLPIHESIMYADYSLQKFFECASKKKWFDDTIFVLTGDHTSISDNQNFSHEVARYRVPLIFYSPKYLKPEIRQDLAQHVDIAPSILDLLHIKTKKRSYFGLSLFQKNKSKRILLSTNSFNGLLQEDLSFTKLYKDDSLIFEKVDPKFFSSTPTIPNKEKADLIKAYTQYFDNGMIENHLQLEL